MTSAVVSNPNTSNRVVNGPRQEDENGTEWSMGQPRKMKDGTG